jgi:hypothetical protein
MKSTIVGVILALIVGVVIVVSAQTNVDGPIISNRKNMLDFSILKLTCDGEEVNPLCLPVLAKHTDEEQPFATTLLHNIFYLLVGVYATVVFIWNYAVYYLGRALDWIAA